MKKGKIKNILRTLMLSLIVIIPSIVFATDKKGDVVNPTHFESTAESCTTFSCELPDNNGDIAFEKTVSKTETEGIYEITLKVKGEDVTKTVEGNTHDIYIAVVLDRSSSMNRPNKYENAKAGAVYFSEKILEKNNTAKLALITFDANTNISRDFSNTPFVDKENGEGNFPDTGSGTNIKDAIKKAHEMLIAQKTENGNEELYMVVLGDGEPYPKECNEENNNKNKTTYDVRRGRHDDDEETICINSATNAKAAKEDQIEIFSIGYELGTEGTEVLKKVAGFKKDGVVYNASDKLDDGKNNDLVKLAQENFTEAKVDTILRKFDKIANKITKTFYAGTDVTITDVIGDNFTYVNNSATLEYTYNGKPYGSSITPKTLPTSDNDNTIEFYLEEVMEITQTIKFRVKLVENKSIDWYDTNKSANANYTDHNGNENQNISIRETAKVYWPQQKYGYTINYCKNNIDNCFKTESGSANLGTEIKAEVDKYLPYGYKFEESISSMTIQETGNILNIIYVKDLEQTKTLTYTVEYYKDNVEVEEDRIEKSKEVWKGENDLINVEPFDKSEKKYTGYILHSITPADLSDKVETGTTIKIYYVKDVTATKELSYTIEYYKDNVLEETKTGKEVVWINDDEIINVDFDLINITNKYVGYKFDSSNPATIPTSVSDGDVIKIYYVKDASQTKPLNYNLKYFTVNGEEITEMDSYNLTESVWINDSNYITVKPIDKSNDRYTGYKYGYTNPETITTKVLSGSTISVYYVKDASQIETLNYTVKFYIDNEEVVEDRIEKEKIVWVNDPYVIDVEEFDMSEDKYYGYKLITDPDTIPTSVETGSIINIYYEKARFEYTVEYYYDGKLDEEKTEVLSDLFGTEITEVEDKAYDNYILSKTENLPLIIDTEDNIIKVYYVESGIGGDIIDPPKTGNSNNYLNILLVLISLMIVKIKNI